METKHFILTSDHLKLIRNMYVGWQDCEFGAPEIDPKRPYGNSYVVGDIHCILEGGHEDDDLTDEQIEEYEKLHRETQTALQIILTTGKFETGSYMCKPYSTDWKRMR